MLIGLQTTSCLNRKKWKSYKQPAWRLQALFKDGTRWVIQIPSQSSRRLIKVNLDIDEDELRIIRTFTFCAGPDVSGLHVPSRIYSPWQRPDAILESPNVRKVQSKAIPVIPAAPVLPLPSPSLPPITIRPSQEVPVMDPAPQGLIGKTISQNTFVIEWEFDHNFVRYLSVPGYEFHLDMQALLDRVDVDASRRNTPRCRTVEGVSNDKLESMKTKLRTLRRQTWKPLFGVVQPDYPGVGPLKPGKDILLGGGIHRAHVLTCDEFRFTTAAIYLIDGRSISEETWRRLAFQHNAGEGSPPTPEEAMDQAFNHAKSLLKSKGGKINIKQIAAIYNVTPQRLTDMVRLYKLSLDMNSDGKMPVPGHENIPDRLKMVIATLSDDNENFQHLAASLLTLPTMPKIEPTRRFCRDLTKIPEKGRRREMIDEQIEKWRNETVRERFVSTISPSDSLEVRIERTLRGTLTRLNSLIPVGQQLKELVPDQIRRQILHVPLAELSEKLAAINRDVL